MAWTKGHELMGITANYSKNDVALHIILHKRITQDV